MVIINMWQHKVIENFNLSQLSEWEPEVSNILTPNTHEGRKIAFAASRLALQEALKALGISASMNELRLINYSGLEKWPELTMSVSHSKNSGAAIVARRSEFRSVGIDLELKDRPVRDDVLKRISHHSDFLHSPLKNWCLKEAIYKCISNSGLINKEFGYSSIQITQDGWQHPLSSLNGSFLLESSNSHLVAMAFISA